MCEGSVITDNTNSSGCAGVRVSGLFFMSGGKISGNTNIGVYMYRSIFFNSECTFTMNGGETSGNAGSGVYVGDGTFTKTGSGTVTGYDAAAEPNGNVVKNSAGVVLSNRGHAVYVSGSKRRESTAGPSVNLDSNVDGAAGGWEN
jgi:hypothetical protein